MKKLYLFSLLLFGALGQAQIVFPDPNLKAALLSEQLFMDTIDFDGDGEISLYEASQWSYPIDISNAGISDLSGLEYFIYVTEIRAQGNQITSIDTSPFIGLEFLDLRDNMLSAFTFDVQTLSTAFGYLRLDLRGNPINTLNIFCGEGSSTDTDVDLLLTEVPSNISVVGEIDAFGYFGTLATSIDIPFKVGSLFMYDAPNLTHINIRNGFSDHLVIENVPNLQHVCVEHNQDQYPMGVEEGIVIDGEILSQWHTAYFEVNRYCTVAEGSNFNEITGSMRYDSAGDGCDANDTAFAHAKFQITGDQEFIVTSRSDGTYSSLLPPGDYSISPVLGSENNYFTVSPAQVPFTFPVAGNLLSQDFCLMANGAHPDLEVSIVPLGFARPGFDANYKLIYKNKGTVTLDGTVSFSHDNTVEYVGANPAVSSQTAQQLNWSFTGLQPFEQREIVVTMNVNSPTETPAVNDGDILTYAASVTHGQTEETPSDNTATLNQTVTNSFDPNDKTCLEGNAIAPSMVGQYVHYKIRFENTGSANATNIVVKDVIDAEKFEISSLVPMDASHDFVTRISGNNVEFIFENIDLPFDDANNDGYVMFKIRTKPTLGIGDSFSNAASIYFDYNHPIVTEPAVTTVQLLGMQDFAFETAFALYPNPAQDVLNIQSKSDLKTQSVEVYNALGQLVIATTDAVNSVDVSKLKTGNYFVKIKTGQGVAQARFVKS
ncbi:T9SS type A sorting domain-containing protein [Flavobacterium caeni]|uniref:Conserved repeat domain-containing protein/Por secretion system C-terminal sorting domain-containing protein n=1 Tax=Flavobacterium caeni TaxID=490189 RepID=A0A1G5D2B1_9FLAO|nr:T9SS type A sorting domain-containing protein [Flavobacterium caeni]SCY08796.1 conserved repeat domain-containing protein/Por secretion system C-terminal sorting domain-containing protein [Flavobacterium caeni]